MARYCNEIFAPTPKKPPKNTSGIGDTKIVWKRFSWFETVISKGKLYFIKEGRQQDKFSSSDLTMALQSILYLISIYLNYLEYKFSYKCSYKKSFDSEC